MKLAEYIGRVSLMYLNKDVKKLTLVVLMLLTTCMIAGCFTRTGSNKVQIFTEMHYSQSYRSQEIPRLLPPEGAIPIDGKGIEYSPEEAKELLNPVPNNSSVLSQGAELYRVNCSTCHAADGKGNGPMAEFLRKWKYSNPADLTAPTTQNRSDGDIFSAISFTIFGRSGISPMPEFSKLLEQDEIWSLVHYIRTLD